MKEHAHFVVAFSLHFLVFDDFSKQNKIPTSFLTTTPFPPVAPPPRCDILTLEGQEGPLVAPVTVLSPGGWGVYYQINFEKADPA